MRRGQVPQLSSPQGPPGTTTSALSRQGQRSPLCCGTSGGRAEWPLLTPGLQQNPVPS